MEHIALDLIDPDAFPRDRSVLGQSDMDELLTSIARDGLRSPIEIVPLATENNDAPQTYGLLSGYRRFTTFKTLADLNPKWQTIPAFIRHPADIPAALRLIAEENAIRADITPWDQSRFAVEARNQGYFETLDAAIKGLFPSVNRQKQSRLRAIAEVVEHFEGQLTDPHTLSQQKLTRLAAAIRNDFTDLMQQALSDQRDQSAGAQWKTLDRILAEAEAEASGTLPTDTRPNKPIRYRKLAGTLTVRRIYQPDGWTLAFTGRDATGDLIERIMDDLTQKFAPDP